jgi:hypothetical protein
LVELAVLVKLLLKWLLGLGMKVIAADSFIQVDVTVLFFDGQSITTTIVSQSLESHLRKRISLPYMCSRRLYYW